MRKLLFNWKRILLFLVVALLALIVGFVAWANDALQPMPEALAALQSDAQVTVSQPNGWYVFTPAAAIPTTGLIFYPGGKVDPRAYAPQMHAVAAQGYLTVITPMPLYLAIFGVNKADEVVNAYPVIQHWGIAGHSLGGSMAAQYLSGSPKVQGLAFWASYPAVDLSKTAIKAVSIYGTNDGLAKQDTIIGSSKLLPPDTPFVTIQGGDHSGFGWYGMQPGDKPATISREDQNAQTVKATVDILASLSQ